jgi:hypothetical protein
MWFRLQWSRIDYRCGYAAKNQDELMLPAHQGGINPNQNIGWLKAARVAWFILAGVTFLLLLAALPGYIAGFPYGSAISVQASQELIFATQVISSLASLGAAFLSISLAVLLFIRRPQDSMALFISYYLLLYALVMTGLLEAFMSYWGFSQEIALNIQTVFATVPTVILLCIFPSGRLVPTWTKWLIAGSGFIILMILIRPDENWTAFSSPYTQIIGGVLGVILILGIYAQVYRYRNTSPLLEREQTKWVLAGLIIWVAYLAVSSVPWFIVQNLPSDQPMPWWVPITSVSWWLSLSIVPLSLSVAILRYRLFDIDVIIRKTLIYGALTITLVLVYFGGVVILQAVFTAISGGQSPIAIVISTLVIAALFSPLRNRIQSDIDRRFFRSNYNARQAVEIFAIRVRDETDLETLCDELIGVAKETMQPGFVSLWLQDSEDNRGDIRINK